MRKISIIGISLIAVIMMAGSCSTSSDVASNKLIQKRKHLKGYHISTKRSLFNKSDLKTSSEDLLVIKTDQTQPSINIDRELRHDHYKKVDFETEQSDNENHIVSASTETKTSSPKLVRTEKNIIQKNETAPELVTNTAKKELKKIIKHQRKSLDSEDTSADDMLILLVILCFIIPPIAVGLKTDWDLTKVIISILLSIFFWIPGVIYALLVVLDAI